MPSLALFLLAAQVGGATSGVVPSPGRFHPVCMGVRVAASDRVLPPKDMTFSSRETVDLLLRPRLRQDLQGEHVMQLKVLTPGGFLYQVLTLPFVSAAPDARGQTAAAPLPRAIPGFPRPLEVQRLVPARSGSGTRGEYELRARLPVAGTSISLGSLYGTWSVQPYIDGQAEPCGPATRFTIRD